MNEQLFRKKSIDRVSSPEQLDAYIRVANPGVWMMLTAIIALLVGVCVWGILGHLNTTVDAVAVCENGAVTIYMEEEKGSLVQSGMDVRIEEECYSITEVSDMPVAAKEKLSDYAMHTGGFDAEIWVYTAATDAQLSDGVYAAEIIVESVTPMSFVMN